MSLRGHIRQVQFSPPSHIETVYEIWSREKCRNAIVAAKAVTEKSRSEGYKRGYQQGKVEALRQFEKSSEKTKKILSSIILQLENAVYSSLREILKREFEVDSSLMQDLMQPLLDKIAGDILEITVHPSKISSIEESLLKCGKKANIIPDSTIGLDKTFFSLPYGEVVIDESQYIEQILNAVKIGRIEWPR